MRLLLACLLATACAAAEPALTVEDLHGHWEVDAGALKTEAQKAAAATAAQVDGYGLTCTQRTCRVALSAERGFAGMWRLDQATATTAVIVVQPRGQDEQRVPIRIEGRHLFVTDDPAGLPLRNTRKP